MCGSTVAKYILFLANLLFLLAGGVLLGVGIAFKVGFNKLTDALPETYNLNVAPTASIVVGAVIFVIAFLGCCGSIKESRFMLFTYATILVLLLIAQIAVGAYALYEINSDKNDVTLESAVTDTVTEVFNHYYTTQAEVVNYIQSQFECCGVISPSYWGTNVPPSCCGSEATSCSSALAYSQGCAKVFYDYLNSSIQIVGGILIGLVATELFGTIFSCCLASSIKAKKGYY